MRKFRMLSLGLLVIGALGISVFCGCENGPDTNNVQDQFNNGNAAGGTRDSQGSFTMEITPSAAVLTNNGAVVSFTVEGASGSSSWTVQDISKGSIITQSGTAATYQRASAGDNVVIATDSRGNAAFATVSQPQERSMPAKSKFKLFIFAFFLIISALAFTPVAQAYIAGMVNNNSKWLNDSTVTPPHWPVHPELGAVSNAHGRVVVALYSIADDGSLSQGDSLSLAPTNLVDQIDLSTIQGDSWVYNLGGQLDPGDYRVIAWIDGNDNWKPDEGEPFGSRDVTVSEKSSVNNIVVNINDDNDSDGLEDWWEVHWFGNTNQTATMDYDNDGLSNKEEYDLIHTNANAIFVEPNNWDTDGDGMDDAWETFYGLDPTSAAGDDGASGDPDGDHIINYDEYVGPDGIGWRKNSTKNHDIADFTTSKDAMNPISKDSDNDGVDDYNELLLDLTHPVHSMSSTNFYPRSLEMSVNNGAGAKITDPDGDLYAFRDGGGTVEFWIRPGSDGNGIIYGFDNVPTNVPHFRISLEDFRPKMEILNGTNIMATVGGVGSDGSVQKLKPDTWTHIAFVIAPKNNSLDLYVDGILLIAQKTFVKPDFVLGSPVICKNFTDGYIDELRIWNYPRSSADIEYWSKRIYPAPGYVQKWASRASGKNVQMYKYARPLLGYFRFDDGGTKVENFAFINYGLYPHHTEYYLTNIFAWVTTNQAVSVSGSDDADGDGLPEWWVGLHNLEKYREYYSSAYGPIVSHCPDDDTKIQGFEYYRSFVAYGSIGNRTPWQENGGEVYHYPKTRPDFYDGTRSSYTRYVYLFSQPVECPLEIFTPGMESTTIYINGTKVTTAGDEANTMQSYDIAQYMQIGRNMIHVECQSIEERVRSVPDYDFSEYLAYNPGLTGDPVGCDDQPYKFSVAIGKFDARLSCNGIPEIVRGDESRSDPRAVWHCQVWSKYFEDDVSSVPLPDRELRAVPENPDYGIPLNAERDNNQLDPDAADDNLDAVYEYICGTNPRDRDSDNNGVSDGDEDFDNDGLVNREEQRFGSDPWLPDSDDDGLIDGADIGSNGHPAQSLSPQKNLGIHFGGAQTDFLRFPKEQRFALNKWTVEAWVKPDSDEADGGIIMQRSVATNAINYEVGLTSANIPYARYVSIGGTEVRTEAPSAITANGATWTHIAASYYDRDLTLYINGTNVASTTGTAFPAIYAGGPIDQNIGRGFKGCIDEMRLWNDNRTATEIINNRDEVLTGLEDSLVAYYRFDDGTSYTNLPPILGTSANNKTNVPNVTVAWTWGQVEDNVLKYAGDWKNQWKHAASFNGDVKFTSDHIITGPPRLQVFIQTDDAIDAGAQWSHNGGAAWNDSRYLETRLPAGDYNISFKEIDGWITPAVTNVTLVRGESTIITGRYVQAAALTVIIDNNSDIKGQATWSIDGGITHHGTGTQIEGLIPGLGYDVIFSDISAEVPGWDRPATIQNVTLTEGESRTITASYTPVLGSLQITFTPDNAPAAGRWRVSGNTNWFSSGVIVTNLSYGDHDVEYNNVQWWQEPANEIINIKDSNLISESRAWTKLPEPSTITTIINPTSAITAGAQWQMNGTTYNSGQSVVVDDGDHTISFNDIDGWLTPPDITATVSGSTTVTGTYYRVDIYGGKGDGDLSAPKGIAANKRYVYIADSANNRIRVLDTYSGIWGSFGAGKSSSVGSFSQPFGVDLDSKGNLWVADTGNHRIQRLSRETGSWRSWGRWGNSIGRFNAPYDIEADSLGNVFVADRNNSRVQRLTANGIWSTFISSGSEEGHVRYPTGIAIASDNSIYVSDYEPAATPDITRIQHFTPFGVLLNQVGYSSDGFGNLNNTRGLAVNSASGLIAADTGSNQVKYRDSGGAWTSLIRSGILQAPDDVAVDEWDNTYIADTENNRVLRLPALDSDSDGIPDAVEVTLSTLPDNPDTDGDNFNDGREFAAGTNPTDPLSMPYYMPLDFAGDLAANIVSYNQGWWHVLMSDVVNHWSDAYKWGTKVDWPVCGDFDGDGVSDFAVFRTTTGRWYINGTQGNLIVQKWGIPGDVPVPNDFDGDGLADFAIFRKNGWWAVKPSSGAPGEKIKWGISGDIPVPGDYDGDGKTDYAVFRPKSNKWYINATTAGIFQKKWGVSGDIPVPADYDGDGITDFAIYRSGWWVIEYSTTSTKVVIKWGVSGDSPVPGDYDGNGKDNVAVFRNRQAKWIIKLDSGERLDVPVLNTKSRPVHPQYRINRSFKITP